MTATVVLVHGAWHGAWCWDRVTPHLDAASVPHVTIDLPGHGQNTEAFVDLYGDADAVTRVLATIDAPVVLVGHSYGGCVITDAGTHPNVAELVYVAAFALDAGESAAAAATEEAASLTHESPGLADLMEIHDDGTCTLPADACGDLLYNCCDAETRTWAAERICPQPFANFTESPRTIAWKDRASTYVVCARDRGIAPGLQRILAARCTTTVELDTDHSPFASRPAELAALLIGIAQRD
jgi:pimeloyl-ACP methyl ester carboxylesterase